MLAEPLAQAIASRAGGAGGAGVATSRTIHLSPAGKPLTHARVVELAGASGCGLCAAGGAVRGHRRAAARARGGRGDRDRRFRRVRRRVAGADADRRDRAAVARRAERRGTRRSEESFVDGLLDCPHYTRPEVYEGDAVPAVLLSGDHALIRRWRLQGVAGATMERRPDLLDGRRAVEGRSEARGGNRARAQSRQGGCRAVSHAPDPQTARIRGRPALRASKKGTNLR